MTQLSLYRPIPLWPFCCGCAPVATTPQTYSDGGFAAFRRRSADGACTAACSENYMVLGSNTKASRSPFVWSRATTLCPYHYTQLSPSNRPCLRRQQTRSSVWSSTCSKTAAVSKPCNRAAWPSWSWRVYGGGLAPGALGQTGAHPSRFERQCAVDRSRVEGGVHFGKEKTADSATDHS